MTTVSIITTCYNAAATIGETIESVRNQVGSFEVEHIITDAGSTDGTLDILGSYGDSLRLVPAQGLKQTEGINAGLKAAQGDILAFLNADDVYERDALQRVVAAFSTQVNRNWLIGQCRIIDEQGHEMQSWITAYKNLLLRYYSYPLLLTENFICQPAVFFRRKIIDQFGLFDEKQHYVMDYEYWLRIGQQERPIILKDYLACFRRFPGTKSNSGFMRQFKDDRTVAQSYAIRSGHWWTIPVKYLHYLKTIGIYRFLYR